ncbi:thiamin pyrophosphokinase 1 [Condylostylus longicornis]|uniref:thiamin pyrophosphokinase 1 n=1 Tax=Condylostylus longicornis TaxID=2530218 RepID=UPI00244E2640|nr:thiamin pyrophosphokinase 1 [Condylostylus longicornis]
MTTVERRNKKNEIRWLPINILESKNLFNYAIIILNTELKVPPEITRSLWNNAKVRITVDGGTNRWLYFLKNFCQDIEMKPPDFITGDFDSVEKDTLDFFYNSLKMHTPNQNETDFTKSLRVLQKETDGVPDIIVIQENAGRFDQIMANLNTLFKAKEILPSKVFLLSSNSLSWLLKPGKHSIEIPADLVSGQRWCCLIPIKNQCTVTTDGLKWNLENSLTQFGGMVSTSNTYARDLVEVNTDETILWSMGVYSFLD